jgi:hypothetical protein
MDRPDGLHAGRTALHRISATGVIVAAGTTDMVGYATAAGHASAEMAVSDVVRNGFRKRYSPRRLLGRSELLFLAEREGLWKLQFRLPSS